MAACAPWRQVFGLIVGEAAASLTLGEPERAASVTEVGVRGGHDQGLEVAHLPTRCGRT